MRLATRQYAVASMDYEGHGQSSGRHVYIKDFDNIVGDVVEQADRVKSEWTGHMVGVPPQLTLVPPLPPSRQSGVSGAALLLVRRVHGRCRGIAGAQETDGGLGRGHSSGSHVQGE